MLYAYNKDACFSPLLLRAGELYLEEFGPVLSGNKQSFFFRIVRYAVQNRGQVPVVLPVCESFNVYGRS